MQLYKSAIQFRESNLFYQTRKDSREIARLIKEVKEEKDKRKKWEWEEQMLQ